MNRKTAIFGFVLIWMVALFAAGKMITPLAISYGTGNNVQVNIFKEQELLIGASLMDADNSGNYFFYEKKVFIRHYRNEFENESSPATMVRNSVIFKPIIRKAKPDVVQKAKETTHGDFDIKPVPFQLK